MPSTDVKLTQTQGNQNLEKRISGFYQEMQDLKGSTPQSGKHTTLSNMISLDSAEFLTEATYNYYYARNGFEGMVNYQFSISEPCTSGSTISEDNVSDAFYKILDSLTVVIHNIDYAERRLATFDLEVQQVGETAVFEVNANIVRGPEPSDEYLVVDNHRQLTGAANHAWAMIDDGFGSGYLTHYAPGIGNIIYGTGQCDVDATNNGNPVGTQNNAPGARWTLRSYGMSNYLGFSATAFGYLVTKIKTTSVSASSVSSPLSPFHAIPGYNNTNIYGLYCDYSSGMLSVPSLVDPNWGYKQWLVTGMMNYYLNFIPGIISGAVPTGKTFYDFNISTPYVNSYNKYSIVTLTYHHTELYYISTGDNSTITLPQDRTPI